MGPITLPAARPKGTWLAKNAYRYSTANGTVSVIDMLGHSMQAVSVAKGSSLTYEFDKEQEGEARLTVAVIPTQPNDRGDIRFSVQIDGGEPQVCSFKEGFRTESWKQNVLRAQALRHTQHTLAKGHHTLTLRALDDHIVFDQWILDFHPDRQYYVIPAE